jgi:hypothetical protein
MGYMELHGITGSSGFCNSHIFSCHVKPDVLLHVSRWYEMVVFNLSQFKRKSLTF